MGLAFIRSRVRGEPETLLAGVQPPRTHGQVAIGPLDTDHSRRTTESAGSIRGTLARMAWVKVPRENQPIFLAALPKDPRVEPIKMFGGVAAKVNGHIFAGLFGRSTMVFLDESNRAAALALDGASMFDPMGDGRRRSDKVMLPESMMADPVELRRWIARAFKAASVLPKKAEKAAPVRSASKQAAAKKQALKAQRRPKQRSTL
jgi:hypothetical protein